VRKKETMTQYGPSSPMTGGASANPAAWLNDIAGHNSADAQAVITAYQTFAPQAGINADLALAQACLETGTFTSHAWTAHRNPAGLGITGDNVEGPTFSVEDGIKAHLDLLRCYYVSKEPIWPVLGSVGFGGFFLGKTALSGMDGVWAVPGNGYGQHIADIANSVVGGNVPTPTPTPQDVYGEDLIVKARQYIGQANSDGTLDTLNQAQFPNHPWAYWCLSFSESVARSFGLQETPRNTAIDKGNAAQAQGLFRNGPPQHGDWMIFGAAFYSEGHIAFFDAEHNGGMALGTLTDGTGIGYANYGPRSTGYMGCLAVPGTTAPYRTQPVPVPSPATTVFPPNNPHNLHITDPAKMIFVGGGFKNKWVNTPDPLSVFGWPLTREISALVMEADGETNQRVVQFFERTIFVYDAKMPNPWNVTCALRSQTVVPL